MRDRENEAMEQTNIIYFVLTTLFLSCSLARRIQHFDNHYAYTDLVVVTVVVIAQKTDVSSCTPCVHTYSTEFSVYVQHLHRIGRCFDSLSTHTHTVCGTHNHICFSYPVVRHTRATSVFVSVYDIFHMVPWRCCLLFVELYTHFSIVCCYSLWPLCSCQCNATLPVSVVFYSIRKKCGRCTLHTAHCVHQHLIVQMIDQENEKAIRFLIDFVFFFFSSLVGQNKYVLC